MSALPIPIRVDTFARLDRYFRSQRGRSRVRLFTAARAHAVVHAAEDLFPGGRAPVGARVRAYVEATNYPTRFATEYQASRVTVTRTATGWDLTDHDRITVDSEDPPPVVELL